MRNIPAIWRRRSPLEVEEPVAGGLASAMSDQPVPYMERTRLYYRALGYESDYVWATFADVPFTRLQKPLTQSKIALLTTASPPDRGNVDSFGVRHVWSGLGADRAGQPFPDNVAWDKESTHTRDRGSYLPIEVATALAGGGGLAGPRRRVHWVAAQEHPA